jgi:SAM-dependent methyltransferase
MLETLAFGGRRRSATPGETHGQPGRQSLDLDSADGRAWSARIRRWVGLKPRELLCLGAGSGFLGLIFARLGHLVTVVEESPETLELMRARAEAAELSLEWYRASLDCLPFSDDSFDLIVGQHLIWTVPNRIRFLMDLERLLRAGGSLVLVERHHPGSRHGGIESARSSGGRTGPLGQSSSDLLRFVGAAGCRQPLIEPLVDPDGPCQAAEDVYALRVRRSW